MLINGVELQHSKQLWVVCIISLFLINKVEGCIVVGGKPFLQACNKERMGEGGMKYIKW